MQAFIVRPFGTRQGIDFDAVEQRLIAPALKEVGIVGWTTQLIAEAGNIRQDMFELLLTAGLVVADISIHNANVFYELGIRHALRSKHTVLIRARGAKPSAKKTAAKKGADDVPFDLRTDRYLEYDPEKPAASRKALVKTLTETIQTAADADSPVFKMLGHGLIPQDLSRFLLPPGDFREEVRRAADESRGGDLSLLSDETSRVPWELEGRRIVGNAQFAIAAREAALVTWERVRAFAPNDVEANGRLATIYQKLGRLPESDAAIARVLENRDIRGPERAELESLRASNEKTMWMAEWQHIDDPRARQEAALRSDRLRRAYEHYSAGFADDRNHFYPGLNALALVTVLLELSARLPRIWAARYPSEADAARARRDLETARTQLAAAVELARQSALRETEFTGKPDKWLEISTADLHCLTSAEADFVAESYRTAFTGARRNHLDSARRQLVIYRRLDVLSAPVEKALALVDEFQTRLPPALPSVDRVIVFTGHRLDAPGRKRPRFPAAAEQQARRMIADAVDRARAGADTVIGIAGGASGGDILFHEVCAERGIRTQLFIVGARDAYVAASVKDGGPKWVERFNQLQRTLPTRVLADSQGTLGLPAWLRRAPDYSIWERSNRWMIHNALDYGTRKVTLIALWNGEPGDGPGGTQDMIRLADERGASTDVLPAGELVAKRPTPPAKAPRGKAVRR